MGVTVMVIGAAFHWAISTRRLDISVTRSYNASVVQLASSTATLDQGWSQLQSGWQESVGHSSHDQYKGGSKTANGSVQRNMAAMPKKLCN